MGNQKNRSHRANSNSNCFIYMYSNLLVHKQNIEHFLCRIRFYRIVCILCGRTTLKRIIEFWSSSLETISLWVWHSIINQSNWSVSVVRSFISLVIICAFGFVRSRSSCYFCRSGIRSTSELSFLLMMAYCLTADKYNVYTVYNIKNKMKSLVFNSIEKVRMLAADFIFQSKHFWHFQHRQHTNTRTHISTQTRTNGFRVELKN